MGLKEQIRKDKLAVHVAIIMDGNGRWARKQGLSRTKGHESGVGAVRKTVEAAAALGIRYLTLYAFSTENWNRPKYEIDALMTLLVQSIHKEMETLMKNNIRIEAISDLNSLRQASQAELSRACEATSGNSGMTLLLALSYSSRWEIVEAAKRIASDAVKGHLDPEKIDLKSFTPYLA